MHLRSTDNVLRWRMAENVVRAPIVDVQNQISKAAASGFFGTRDILACSGSGGDIDAGFFIFFNYYIDNLIFCITFLLLYTNKNRNR